MTERTDEPQQCERTPAGEVDPWYDADLTPDLCDALETLSRRCHAVEVDDR